MNYNIFFSYTHTGELSHPRPTSFSRLDQCHHLHFGRNSQFSHPSVRPLQIHPQQMLQEGLQENIIGQYLCKNTNGRQNEVLDFTLTK